MERWDIPDNVRKAAPVIMGRVMADPEASDRDKIGAVKALVAMDKVNVDATKAVPQVTVNVAPIVEILVDTHQEYIEAKSIIEAARKNGGNLSPQKAEAVSQE